MAGALAATLELAVPRDAAADVLLITDGEIWAIDALMRRLADSRHRLFVLAIGASPVEELARKISEITRGACEFVTPGEDMGGAVTRLLAKIRTPSLEIASIDWPGAQDWTVGKNQAIFAGDTVHLFGGFVAAPSGSVAVTLRGDAEPAMVSELPEPSESGSTLARVAAMRRLAGLEPAEASALAERYALVTKYTSCVVVLARPDGEKSDADPKLRVVPQMLAAGWGATGDVNGASASESLFLRSPALPGTIPPEAASAFLRRSGVGEQKHLSHSDSARTADRHPGLTRNDNGPLVSALPRPSIAARLAERLVERREPMPSTVEDLRALGVPEEILERLRETIAEGNTERDVVVAWLAIFAWSRAGTSLGVRLKARLALAADGELRSQISRRLPDIRLS
jgi:Ca-activated chloride channel family protein